MRFFFILAVLFLSSCEADKEAFLLRWKVDSNSVLEYETVITKIKINEDFRSNGFNLLEDSALRDAYYHQLVDFSLPYATYVTKVTRIKNRIRVEIIGALPEYQSAPQSEEEKMERELVESRSGMRELLADIDESGNLESFYLKQKQRNIVSLLFALPQGPVAVGDSWSLPVTLTEIGQGFNPNKTRRENKVTLQSVSQNDHGDLVARLFYVIAELVEGQFEYSHTDEVVPISSEYAYVGYGDFNIDKGKWEDFKLIAHLAATGLSQTENMMVYGLFDQ